jgi:nitroreductase
MLDMINSRRSVRQWKNEPVSDSDIQKILEAAMNAPSAGNEQPWHFIVVKDKDLLVKASAINPYGGFVKNAPLAILVCGDTRLERFKGYWVQDCSLAVENMLLAAHALGLGAVWTSIYPIEERVSGCRKLFNLPEDVIPLTLIPIGYPLVTAGERKSRFDASRVRQNTW